MNIKKCMLFACLPLLAISSLVGCKKGPQVSGSNVVQIVIYKGSYGIEWVKKLGEEFSKTFPGKSIKIEEASSLVGEKQRQDLMTPSKNQIDLYLFGNANMAEIIASSKGVLKTSNYTLLEPLDEVFESKAIGFDGKEEEETIASRFYGGYSETGRYHGKVEKWNGVLYKLPWADGATGLFVNKPVLDKYGIDIPVTTDELQAAVEEIHSHTSADKVYPYSWAGSNASGYWSYIWETWFAQYSGIEAFENFVKCDPGNGNIEEEGYKVYEDEGILHSLDTMVDLLDLNYSPNGSYNKTHMEADNDFLNKKSAFMVGGDWFLGEMAGYYYDEAKEIIMMKTPVISKIGTELGLTDQEFHDTIVRVDNGESDDAIIAAHPQLNATGIARIREARSIYSALGCNHDMVIPSYADAKETAKLFLRFMYSNDGCRLFRSYAYSNLPLRYETKEGDRQCTFLTSLDNNSKTPGRHFVDMEMKLNDVRSLCSILPFNSQSWRSALTFKSIFDYKSTNSDLTGKMIFDEEKAVAKEKWATWMVNYYQ